MQYLQEVLEHAKKDRQEMFDYSLARTSQAACQEEAGSADEGELTREPAGHSSGVRERNSYQDGYHDGYRAGLKVRDDEVFEKGFDKGYQRGYERGYHKSKSSERRRASDSARSRPY
jgi:flagellar biosynthesis/type III secretory pathway protein FliH